MFEVLESFIKPISFYEMKWSKYNRHRVEISIPTEILKCQNRQ